MKLPRMLVAVPLVAVTLGGLSASAAPTTGGGTAEWILLTSDREGTPRGYSVRPDGSRLTQLPPFDLTPESLSGDGGTIAYKGTDGIYVSRADGTRLHRVMRDSAAEPLALSRDGSLLAVDRSTRNGSHEIDVVGTHGGGLRQLASAEVVEGLGWSPDGTAVAFLSGTHKGIRDTLTVQPLHGKGRKLVQGVIVDSPRWSPDGRWIAYATRNGIFVIRPNGTRLHRVADGFDFAWAPDGDKLAFDGGIADIAVVSVEGRGMRRLHVPLAKLAHGSQRRWPHTVTWSPDGRLLAFDYGDPSYSGGFSDIWVIGADGRGLRRVVRGGVSRVLGWTRFAPARG